MKVNDIIWIQQTILERRLLLYIVFFSSTSFARLYYSGRKYYFSLPATQQLRVTPSPVLEILLKRFRLKHNAVDSLQQVQL